MGKRYLLSAGLVAALFAGSAGASELSDYSIEELLSPCQESDNDSRWGAAAEAECEQYLRGFTDAYLLTIGSGGEGGICLPDQNRDDEVRWAYMKWVARHYDQRSRPAAEGLLATLKESFKCE